MKTTKHGLNNLTREIRNNLLDEIGTSRKDGKTPTNFGAHEDWRKTFYTALGIADEVLENASILNSPRAYREGIIKTHNESDV